MLINSAADCEVQSVIKFLNAQRFCPAEIHQQLVKVYGEGVIDDGNERKWCWFINRGRTNVHDGE